MKTAADHARAARARDRQAAEATAERWLQSFVKTAKPGPIAAGDLFALACRAEWRTSDHVGRRGYFVEPGRTTFYRVADRILGERRHTHRKTPTYAIPEPPAMPDAYATAILDRAARLLLEEARPSLNRLGLAADDPAPRSSTGTDGVVVDLGSRRH